MRMQEAMAAVAGNNTMETSTMLKRAADSPGSPPAQGKRTPATNPDLQAHPTLG